MFQVRNLLLLLNGPLPRLVVRFPGSRSDDEVAVEYKSRWQSHGLKGAVIAYHAGNSQGFGAVCGDSGKRNIAAFQDFNFQGAGFVTSVVALVESPVRRCIIFLLCTVHMVLQQF